MPKKKKKKKAKKKARINKNKKRAKKIVVKRRQKAKPRVKHKTIKIKFNRKKNLFLIKLIKFQENLIQKFKFKINFSLDRKIQSFFDAIDEKIQAYKVIRAEEKAKIKLKELERVEKEKEEAEQKRKENLELEFKLKEKALKEQEKRLEQIKKISELLKKDKQYYSELQLEVKALENELKYLIGDKKGSSYERGGTAHLIYGTWKGSENNGWQELVLIGDRGIFSKQEMLIITNAIKAPEGKDGYASFFWRWDNENSDYKQDAYSGTVREWLSENGPWGPVKTRTK